MFKPSALVFSPSVLCSSLQSWSKEHLKPFAKQSKRFCLYVHVDISDRESPVPRCFHCYRLPPQEARHLWPCLCWCWAGATTTKGKQRWRFPFSKKHTTLVKCYLENKRDVFTQIQKHIRSTLDLSCKVPAERVLDTAKLGKQCFFDIFVVTLSSF